MMPAWPIAVTAGWKWWTESCNSARRKVAHAAQLRHYGRSRFGSPHVFCLNCAGKARNFPRPMKTSADAMVLDEPKKQRSGSKPVVKPALDAEATDGSAPEARIYIDGKFYAEAEAKISVFDHGLLYGDGVFEG